MKYTFIGRYTSTLRCFLPMQGRMRYISLTEQWHQISARIDAHFMEGPVRAGERLADAEMRLLAAREYEVRMALEEMELLGY